MAKSKDEFTFEIVEEIAVLSDRSERGWRKECNLVRWGDAKEPVYDIRSWNEDHTKMSKGISMNYDEIAILASELMDRGLC